MVGPVVVVVPVVVGVVAGGVGVVLVFGVVGVLEVGGVVGVVFGVVGVVVGAAVQFWATRRSTVSAPWARLSRTFWLTEVGNCSIRAFNAAASLRAAAQS